LTIVATAGADSGSITALHRYCVGKALPPDFAFVRRLARLVGVRGRELDSLYRLWLRAQL